MNRLSLRSSRPLAPRSKLRAAGAGLLAFVLACPPARALVAFNDGTDHLYLTTSGSVAYDSNIFAHNGGEGDTIYSASLLLEYARRAGLIAVDGSLELDASRFGDNTDQNFNNPKLDLKLHKDSGRTTGSLSLGAERVSEADAVANLRTTSWNYLANLDFKYPVIERYSFAGHLGFSDRIYDDTAVLANLRTYTAGTDLLYALTSERNLLAGYQFRHSETSASSSYDDQSFTAGVTGKIIAKLSGSLRAGYEFRSPRGASSDGAYHGLTASGSATWTVSSKLSVAGTLGRDVSVTANDQSVDTTSAGLNLAYTLNDRLSWSANTGVGRSRFLTAKDAGRHDEYFSWGTGLKYKMNDHLDSSLGYTYNENWSTFSYSDFTRHTVSLTLSSRW